MMLSKKTMLTSQLNDSMQYLDNSKSLIVQMRIDLILPYSVKRSFYDISVYYIGTTISLK